MTEIQIFINKIRLLEEKSEKLQKIVNFADLIKCLQELDDLVEIYNVKTVILRHIEMLLVLTMTKDNDLIVTDNHMLHTVIYGHPGVGKSRTAKILSKIWKALGILKNIKMDTTIDIKTILSRVNSIRDKYLTLYELNQNADMKEYKKMWKSYNEQWSSIKNELSELASTLHKGITNNHEIVNREDDLIVVAGRENFVAEYSGQTAIKTLNFLKSCLGKCVIIEEAYLLYHGESDIYGLEALTVLNRFMDEFAAYIAIIFTGYEDKLKETIFKAQPGLRRRCQWIFNLRGYSHEGLYHIFLKQLHELNWSFENDTDVYEFFREHALKFPNFGGDTEKLAVHCKMMFSHSTFDNIINSQNPISISLKLNKDMLYQAFENYCVHDI